MLIENKDMSEGWDESSVNVKAAFYMRSVEIMCDLIAIKSKLLVHCYLMKTEVKSFEGEWYDEIRLHSTLLVCVIRS